MPPPRVVIVDRHAGVRHALESLIRLTGTGVVVGTARDVAGAGRLARSEGADVVVVDADLLSDQHAALGPLASAVAIIATGMERHRAATECAARRGAAGYVVKDQAHTELPAVLRAVRPRAVSSRSTRG